MRSFATYGTLLILGGVQPNSCVRLVQLKEGKRASMTHRASLCCFMSWHLEILFTAVKQSFCLQHMSTALGSSSIFELAELQTTFVQIKLLWLTAYSDNKKLQEATVTTSNKSQTSESWTSSREA